jgi:hypothetical protein
LVPANRWFEETRSFATSWESRSSNSRFAMIENRSSPRRNPSTVQAIALDVGPFFRCSIASAWPSLPPYGSRVRRTTEQKRLQSAL